MSSTAVTRITTKLDGIGHVIRDRPLVVPPYQRSYAWWEEQVETFWWDLRATMASAEPDYFLGTIVMTTGSDSSATVVDGQQRLATATMLFAAIRDAFLERDDDYRAVVIERDYVASRDLRTAHYEPRLRLNTDDDGFFRDLVITHPGERGTPAPATGSNRRISRAFEILTGHIRDEVSAAGGNWAEMLFRWVEFLESSARVISVEVSDEADAFLIFETLNDRGLDLTVADLLKNYLFGVARDELDQVQDGWTASLEALETTTDEETVTTFIRHYWSAQAGATRERELYSRLKSNINSPSSARDFVADLSEAAPFYAALLNSAHPQWSLWEDIGAEVDTLFRLGLEQNRPLLLAAMRHFDGELIQGLLRALIGWSVRGLIVGGIGAGTTERAYAEAATKVTRGRIRAVDALLDELSPIIPFDDAFARAFTERRVNKTRLARYYLIAVHKQVSGEALASIVSEAEESGYRLEAVLPRRAPPEDWPDFPEPDIRQWALRLGNQIVIPSEESENEGHGSRVEALTGVGEPLLEPASSWTAEAIAERQRVMGELAPAIWPREIAG